MGTARNVRIFDESRPPSKPVSLRKILTSQGVTDEAAVRAHVNFIFETMKENPLLDVTKYRVNPENPNSLFPMMG